jgi:serine phosphatase RsbU (regulator of sigma subunit)
LDARALVDRVMREADAFADGAAQHDDMTVVAMRLTE